MSNDDTPPVAFMDFSAICPDYDPKEKEVGNEHRKTETGN